MDQNAVATRLLMFLASGGTIERLTAELPSLKAEIDSAFDWLKTGGRCSASEVLARAKRLGEFTTQKLDALKNEDYELAVSTRAHAIAVYESFWLKAPLGKEHQISFGEIPQQIKTLSKMFNETQAA